MAREYSLFSSEDDGATWILRHTYETADCNPNEKEYNGFTRFKGWAGETTTHLKMLLNKGKLDPWGMKKYFGIRRFDVIGVRPSSSATLGCTASAMLLHAAKRHFLSGVTSVDKNLYGPMLAGVKYIESELEKVKKVLYSGIASKDIVDVAFGKPVTCTANNAHAWKITG